MSRLLPLLLVAAAALRVHGRGGPSVLSADFQGETFDLPEGFLFGAGTSALQVEGSEHEDGKGASVMDMQLEHMSELPLPPDSPYIEMKPPGKAADSYRRYKEDVKMAKELKLQVYRFSVSWPRVLPDADPNNINQAGIDYYNNLIDELIKNGIQPMVTMNHHDYPMAVMEKVGGWVDKRVVDMFEGYADVLFRTFGDRVKLWTTINEPNYFCMTLAQMPYPGYFDPQPGDDYKCVHHTVLAHMKAYRLYERKYKATQGGKIGAASLALWSTPNSTSFEDIQASERSNVFSLGSIFHPVVFGDYPEALRQRVDHYSRLEGRSESRLPRFTDEEKMMLKGSADFLCFNAYTGTVVADSTYAPRPAAGSMKTDRDAVEVGTDTTPGHFADLLMQASPWVLREAPKWLHETYKMPIFITENGWGDQRTGDSVDPRRDGPRVGYHSEYLQQLMRAHKEDNVDIMGYLVWSLLDSYEFTAGFSRKFGLVHVDYEGGTLDRSLKDSAWFFRYIGEHRKVPIVAFQLTSGAGSTAPALILAAIVLATATWRFQT